MSIFDIQMRRVFCVYLTLFFALIGKAQSGLFSEPNWYIKPYVNFSAMIQHRSILGNVIKGYPMTYELNIVKPTSGSHLWHLENNKPDIGINLSLIDYANPQQLGYGIVVAPFAEIPLNEKDKPSRMILRLCWGPAYMTKRFDLRENQKNGAIGSGLNAYVQFKWFWQFDLNDRLRLEPGFMFSHISNARAQSPNLGLNVFGVGLGVNIKATKKQFSVASVDSSTKNKSKHEIFVTQNIGMNDGEIMGKKQFVSCLAIGYNFNKRNTHKFGVGFDVFYEENYVKDLRNAGIAEPSTFDKLRYGPKLAYSYNMGRISFPVEMGVYLRQLSEPDGVFFHRLGVRYFGYNGLVIAFGMRSHWAVAYNFEFGAGYRFRL